MIVVESALFFSVFGTLLWRRFQRISRGKKAQKTKNTFPIFFFIPFVFLSFFSCFVSFFLCFFLSFSLFLSFTNSFLYLSFFSLPLFSLFLGEKNHQNHRNHRKSPKTPKSPKITEITENTQKPYKNRGAKNNFCKNHETLRKWGRKSPWNATRPVKISF